MNYYGIQRAQDKRAANAGRTYFSRNQGFTPLPFYLMFIKTTCRKIRFKKDCVCEQLDTDSSIC